MKNLNDIIKRLSVDRKFRQELTRKSHFWFFHLFFAHYITYPLAWFHREMIELSENLSLKLLVIMAFRGSGKSTIMNLSYALWSILGKPQKKFVVIISRSRAQAKAHFQNIKQELEENELLKNDLGPFITDSDDHGTNAIYLKKFGAKVMMISAGQSTRGLRHKSHRPDLIICDDIEDSQSAMNEHERKRISHWFLTEVLPAGDKKTMIVVLGNLLHCESLLIKLRDMIIEKGFPGIFKAYPIVDDDGRALWPEKFTTQAMITEVQNSIIDYGIWSREFLLKVGGWGYNDGIQISSPWKPAIFLKAGESLPPKENLTPFNKYGYRISAPVIHYSVDICVIRPVDKEAVGDT